MRNSDETAVWVDRTAVLIECDQLEEKGKATDQVALTRLHDRLLNGESLCEDELTTIRELSSRLGIETQKRFMVSTDSRRYGQVILSNPLGPYYTKISLPYSLYTTKGVCEAWDQNPIESCEISMIPGNLKIEDFRSHRLNRCLAISLHFDAGFTDVLKLLLAVEFTNCLVLEIRNPRLTESQLKVLKIRLNWPRLQTIIQPKVT